jgi:hypothetical protein
MQFGPLTEQETLDENEKKKQALRSYLTQKYSAPVAEEAPPSNENQRIASDLVTNLGSAFEQFGRGASVARGGVRDDGSFYMDVNSQVQGKFDRDEKKLKDEQLKKRQLQDDTWNADVKNRQVQEWADSDADRATKTADLEAEKDPTSQQSVMAQELAKRLMPSKDFTGMSAAQLKNAIPTLEKLYAIEENNKAKIEAAKALQAERSVARNDREQARADVREDRQYKRQEELKLRELETNIPGYEKTGEAAIKASDAEKLRKAAATQETIDAQLNELRDLQSKYGNFETGPNGERMLALSSSIQLKLKELENLGVLNGPDLSILQKQIPDVGGWSGLNPTNRNDNTAAKLEQAQKMIRGMTEKTLEKSGFRKAGAQQQDAPPKKNFTHEDF